MNILLKNRDVNCDIAPPSDNLSKYGKLCNDAAWRLRWDYNGWKSNAFSGSLTQRDWNQTLITKINQISAQIHQATLRGGANTIVVSPEIEKVFKTIEYYKVKDKSVGGRYKVIVDNEIDPMSILIYYDTPHEIEVQFLNTSTIICGRENLEAHKPKFYGCIKVDGLGCDAENELTKMLSDNIAKRIDEEIISGLKNTVKPNRRLLLLSKNLVV